MKYLLPIICTVITLGFGAFVLYAKWKLRLDYIAPEGCLGCNPKAVRRALLAAKVDPSTFVAIPPSRHAWNDIVPCPKCGQQWLVMPRGPS